MIQRIQSLFLVLAASLNLLVLFFPMGAASNTSSMEGNTITMHGSYLAQQGFDEEAFAFVDKTIGFSDNTLVMVHTLLAGLVSLYLLILIFLYQDRQRQAKLGYVGIGMLMIQIVVAALLFMKLPELVGATEAGDPHDVQYGFAFPVVALIFTWLAIRRIQKDERLVRDMDRIR